MKEIQNYINGKFQSPVKGITLDDINPATGEIIGTVPASTSDDVQPVSYTHLTLPTNREV